MSEITKDIQERITELKHNYEVKKSTLVKKVTKQQKDIEDLFKIYYSTLDTMRGDILKQEYSIRQTMASFDSELKNLVSNLSKNSLLEFYHDEVNIKKSISSLQNKLESFSVYLPQWKLKEADMNQISTQIKVDVRERINQVLERVDHSFGLDNYRYVIEQISDAKIKDIYKKLGPFDHFEYASVSDESVEKNLRLDFDQRKSGALYRGQTN